MNEHGPNASDSEAATDRSPDAKPAVPPSLFSAVGSQPPTCLFGGGQATTEPGPAARPSLFGATETGVSTDAPQAKDQPSQQASLFSTRSPQGDESTATPPGLFSTPAPPPAAAPASPVAARPGLFGPAPAARSPEPSTNTALPAASAPAVSMREAPVRFGGRSTADLVRLGMCAIAATVAIAAALVLATRWLLARHSLQHFLVAHPGSYSLPSSAPTGIPWWADLEHFFNALLMLLIVRTGLQMRRDTNPGAFWIPRWNPNRRISLTSWLHQALDLLWLVNGGIFAVLMFASGQWMRIIPTSWAVFPNALTALLKYLALEWPATDGWTNYNSLQELVYFTTVFIAAPLAIASGVRLSGLWPKQATRLSKLYSTDSARRVHRVVMVYFVGFVAIHLFLVFATGPRGNLNHMFASQDVSSWTGLAVFVGSLLVMLGAWLAARPLIVAPIAGRFGRIGR